MWGILAAVAALLYAIFKYRQMFKGFEKVDDMFPGLPTVPFLGNALYFAGNTHDVCKQVLHLSTLYRRSFRVWIGPFMWIGLQRPSDVEVLLNNTVHIKKSTVYDVLLPWIKRGLLTSYGSKWRKNRKVLTPAFHFKILENFLEIFNKNGVKMCQVLEKKVGTPWFDAMDIVKLCAMDNISETAMGVSLNALENPNSEYMSAIKRMCYLVYLRNMRPWYRLNFFFYLTKYGREEKKTLNILHTYTRDIINKRMQKRKEEGQKSEGNPSDDIGIKNKKAFLDLLLDYYEEGTLSLDEIQEEVDTFLFEGHDTISSALSFAIYALANNQNIQERAYQEQNEIFGSDNRSPSHDDLQNMKYLEMVLKESLRLYPSVPALGRIIEQDLKLDDFSTIPAGAEALVVVAAVHRNPDVWERPDEFDPDRFLPENVVKRHPYSYIPFSAGPRNCIGMKFAMMEMKATMSKLLRRFRLNPSNPKKDLKLVMEVTLQSATGMPISVQLRTTL